MTRPIAPVIAALGLTQIVGWGTTHYMPAILAGPIAHGIGATTTTVLGSFSWGLLVAAASARASGRLMDRHGARRVMTVASLLAASGLLVLSFADGWPMLFAGWTLIGLAMRSILYDGAFAALAALAGDGARRAISLLTLFGGFASTIFWPIGAWLDATVGWRGTLQLYALLNVVPCALLHLRFAGGGPRSGAIQQPMSGALAGASERAAASASERAAPSASGQVDTGMGLTDARYERALLLAVAGFTLHAFVASAMSAHLVLLLGGFGFGAAVVVSAASLMGVAQVAARIAEMSLQQRLSAVAIAVPSVAFLPAAFAVVLGLPALPWVAALFVTLYGCANGLLTIVRGALPLAVFGRRGYGELLGRIAGPGLLAAALAPVSFAALVEALGSQAGLWLLALCAVGAFAAIFALSRLAGEAQRRLL